jgi:hypothetical protein
MVRLLFGSFIGNFQDLMADAPDATGTLGLVAMSQGSYVAVVGLMLALSAAGLISSLRARER